MARPYPVFANVTIGLQRYESIVHLRKNSNGRSNPARGLHTRMAAAFFHKGISRLHSEELLLQAGDDGSFLVRDSESVTGAYVLCLLYQKRVHQYRILPDKEGRISVQSEGDMQPPCYNDLPSLITSYINKNEKNGLVCALRKPVSPEGAEIPEADSEDDDFDDSKTPAETEDKSSNSKTFKFGLLNKFDRLDLSSCDGEFVDAMKTYIDEGLEKDATSCNSSTVEGTSGSYHMPEFQKLIAIAGKGLHRELDIFLLKLSMCHDMLSHEDDDKKRTLTSNPLDRLGSYIDFMASKLETCRTQILALEKKAKDVMKESQEEEDYAYPDVGEVNLTQISTPMTPLLRRHSTVTIPLSSFDVKVLKHGKTNYKLKLTVDIHQGRFYAVKPSKELLDASNMFAHDKIIQLVKNTTENSRLHVIFDNKKKYTYQFDSAHERENFCLQIRQMKSVHSHLQETDNVSLFIGTWNMGKSAPVESLKFWFKCSGDGKSKDRTLSRLPHDLYVIGTQESGMTEKDWINTIKAQLKAVLNLDVDLVESCSLWGLRTLVFVNPRHRNSISHVQKSYVRTGIANALGNKGAAAVSFLLSGTSFCFINAHLTSGEERLDRRNANFRDILKGLSMGSKNLENYDVTHKFHHVFFFGDLNYRVSEPVELVLHKVDRRELSPLLEQDQLRRCQFEKRAFFGFSESEINFMPTYRLERMSPGYRYDWKKAKASGDRINAPSWCDRILWHSFPGTFIENTAYGSVENLLNSDHRPVFASFTVGIASPFIQNRASLQDASVVKFVFKRIEAQIRTSTKQFYILEFSSSCMPDIICCESNKRFGGSQKAGFTMNPIWLADQLPQLRPLFGDADYLEDQHILIAVKGSGEDHESYGECVLSLKDMFTGEPCYFEATMTHFGEETGKLKGEWYVSCGASTRLRSRASRKTYEIVALDTEYHDPEEFLSLSPPIDPVHTNLFPTPSSASQMSSASSVSSPLTTPPPGSAVFSEDDQFPIPSHYMNHNIARRIPSDPVPAIPESDVNGESPPPIPSKRGKAPLMGQLSLHTNQSKSGAPSSSVPKPVVTAKTVQAQIAAFTSTGPSHSPSLATSGVHASPGADGLAALGAMVADTASGIGGPHTVHGPKVNAPKPSDNVTGSPAATKAGSKVPPDVANKPWSESPPPRHGATQAWQQHIAKGGDPGSPTFSPKSTVTPSAPPMHDCEIYPSIAIRPYEELKKPTSVQEWLTGLGLAEYTAVFLRNGWDSMSTLSGLNAASVMKMGIRDAEHRMRILNSVREMKGGSM